MSRLVWRRARRPCGIVEATRWLFAVLVLVTLLFTLPALLFTPNPTMRLVGLASAAVLALSWGTGYLQRSAPLVADLVDAVALLAFALACPDLMVAVGLVMPALWFRSLYGSAVRAVLRAGLYAVALVASLALWAYIPGHPASAEASGLMLGVLPTMCLAVIASRHLAGGLRAREQVAQHNLVHRSAGSQLLGVTDVVEIERIAWGAIAGICEATPGLRALKVVRSGKLLRVDWATGGFADIPETLPAAAVTVSNSAGQGRGDWVCGHPVLDTAVGAACVWVCIPSPDERTLDGSTLLLLGSPGKVSKDVIAAIGTLTDQVALALSNAEALQKLTLQATLDSLTGLANRGTFNAGLSAALNDQSRGDTTVLFIDLDAFKRVNDLLGHGAGDDLLQEVASRLCLATRPDDLCARLGGDEFAVLLRDTDEAVAAVVAQRIVESIAAIVQLGAGFRQISASVGVATATRSTNLEQLLHQADLAMYTAKTRGKARIQIFEPGLLQGDSSQLSFERQLAASAANGELVVCYQPVMSLPDGRCVAVEALVRWQHPQRGLLHPDSFIEIAERIGAIGDIGGYVLRRACADAAGWRESHTGAPLAIHVNVSALQLNDKGFTDNVKQCLVDFVLAPEQLVLEVTETVVISSPLAIDRINNLAAHGVRIAIDDFGTGYSALTTLRTLPAQIVKIDKSFVSGSSHSPQDRAVIEAVVKMAAQMGMRTVAEGVENIEQQSFLQAIGADAAQGYLYLHPTTARAFETWLIEHTSNHLTSSQT